MGDAINMAARIMCLAGAQNTILCDERTYNLCSSFFTFNILGEFNVKGKNVPISVFQPLRAFQKSEIWKKTHLGTSALIGRSTELKEIEKILNSIGIEGLNNLIFEADEGQGLSSLCNYVQEKFKERNHAFMYL